MTTTTNIHQLHRAPRSLSVVLATEDDAEDIGLLAPDDRLTCHVHGRWMHQCVSSPLHVNQITRHRWCRDCRCELTVAVDELAHVVSMTCPGCGNGGSPATARLIAACRASLDIVRPLPVQAAA